MSNPQGTSTFTTNSYETLMMVLASVVVGYSRVWGMVEEKLCSMVDAGWILPSCSSTIVFVSVFVLLLAVYRMCWVKTANAESVLPLPFSTIMLAGSVSPMQYACLGIATVNTIGPEVQHQQQSVVCVSFLTGLSKSVSSNFTSRTTGNKKLACSSLNKPGASGCEQWALKG